VDPSSILVTALEKALAIAGESLAKAVAVNKANVAACLHYLRAAQAAVMGLEEELDEILIQAKAVARFRWDERAIAFERIDRYLNRDRLRPILDQSLHGLLACRAQMEKDANGFFARQEKAELVSSISDALDDLFRYLRSLSGAMGYTRENYAGSSGINMPELIAIQRLLESTDTAWAVVEAVEALQGRRRKEGLALVADATKLMQELSVVFKLTAHQ
jgi:hypothetical protein